MKPSFLTYNFTPPLKQLQAITQSPNTPHLQQ
jgi:hypothetical protein